MNVLAAIPQPFRKGLIESQKGACYTERVAIGSVALLARKHIDEVLVIDDGSSDGTATVAQEAGVTVIRHEQNKGKGAAVKTALHYAAANGFDAGLMGEPLLVKSDTTYLR